MVKGKAFDNRVGCAMLLELLESDYPFDLLAVFTVQEEVGARGAAVATYTANPDCAFVLEAPTTDDLPPPEEDAPEGFPRIGDGPVITVMDRSMISNRRLVDLLVNTAEAEGIPYQFKRPGIGGTDAGAIHKVREGVPSVVVSVPTRYIHAPVALLDLADFWHTVKLMQATLNRLPQELT
jgi:endoglucanase